MQRAIAAEAALAAAVVAGEVDLTAVDNDEEGEQVQAGDVEGDDQAEGAGGSRVGVGTRRSAPLRTDDDVEVHMSADLHIVLAVCMCNKMQVGVPCCRGNSIAHLLALSISASASCILLW